jgi:hypothetical protein
MATPRITHDQRERIVFTEVENHFPNFAGQRGPWIKVPDGYDPPDFTSSDSRGVIGLELVEWLDGSQMGPAQSRESQREQIRRILAPGWEQEHQPTNFRGAFPSLIGTERVAPRNELQLRREFYAYSAQVDRNWSADIEHWGNSLRQTEFTGYPLLARFFSAINFIGGDPHGYCWIGEDGDGGAFDPLLPVVALKQALGNKLTAYSKPEKLAHLKSSNLKELDLLVHGGFNVYAYNTPAGHLNLEAISRHAADFYASHPLRPIFSRVWFFHSLDPADEVNRLLGFPPGTGRVSWLAQLWPDFRIYPGSIDS